MAAAVIDERRIGEEGLLGSPSLPLFPDLSVIPSGSL
jgi:hypothetical protein